jgi:hypothetical protein
MRWYGWLGALMMIFAELNFILKIEPFAMFGSQIVWFGFIFLIDALVYARSRRSLLSTNRAQFLLLLLLSTGWWIFEIINIRLGTWHFISEGQPYNLFAPVHVLIATTAIFVALPAFFEIFGLFKSFNLFSQVRLNIRFKITKTFLLSFIGFGVFCLVTPLILPKPFFPLIWFAFFFILDPVNYLRNQPSIIEHLKDKRLQVPLILMLSGVTQGFLWEVWNFWAPMKWVYTVPYFGFFKVFEMPILGYLGYLFSALSLYSIYYSVYPLFRKKFGRLIELN